MREVVVERHIVGALDPEQQSIKCKLPRTGVSVDVFKDCHGRLQAVYYDQKRNINSDICDDLNSTLDSLLQNIMMSKRLPIRSVDSFSDLSKELGKRVIADEVFKIGTEYKKSPMDITYVGDLERHLLRPGDYQLHKPLEIWADKSLHNTTRWVLIEEPIFTAMNMRVCDLDAVQLASLGTEHITRGLYPLALQAYALAGDIGGVESVGHAYMKMGELFYAKEAYVVADSRSGLDSVESKFIELAQQSELLSDTGPEWADQKEQMVRLGHSLVGNKKLKEAAEMYRRAGRDDLAKRVHDIKIRLLTP